MGSEGKGSSLQVLKVYLIMELKYTFANCSNIENDNSPFKTSVKH